MFVMMDACGCVISRSMYMLLRDDVIFTSPLRERAVEVLQNLVRFPSVSLSPNEGIVSYIETYLASHGISSVRDAHEDGQRFNLLARIGRLKGRKDLKAASCCPDIWMWPADASGWSN